jgi:hypothetical protein
MNKPIVNYIKETAFPIAVGNVARVETTNHPDCSNTNYVQTSRVIIYNSLTGEFETMNSKYVPI